MIGLLPEWMNPDKTQGWEHLVGRQQATHETIKAMLRYLPEQSVHVFAPDDSADAFRRDVSRFAANEGGNYASMSVAGTRSLPAALQQPFTAFHNPASPHLHTLAYIRSTFSPHTYPITLSEVYSRTARKYNQTADRILRHLMWLIKYGLAGITIKPSGNVTSS